MINQQHEIMQKMARQGKQYDRWIESARYICFMKSMHLKEKTFAVYYPAMLRTADRVRIAAIKEFNQAFESCVDLYDVCNRIKHQLNDFSRIPIDRMGHQEAGKAAVLLQMVDFYETEVPRSYWRGKFSCEMKEYLHKIAAEGRMKGQQNWFLA